MNDETGLLAGSANRTSRTESAAGDRRARARLLERYGAFYARQGFAVVWTETNDPARGDPKAVTTKAWPTTVPHRNPEYMAGIFAVRGRTRNPAITARTSGLVLIDCDTPEGLAEVEALGLPETLTVRSSADWKRHWYFRPPADVERLPLVGFRFEAGGFSGDRERYLVAPPALHPSGAVYRFRPGTVEVAELPASVYQALAQRAEGVREQEQREPVTAGAKIQAGRRRESIFRYACALRRWEPDRAAVEAEAQRWNLAHCDPPVARILVSRQVDGAFRYAGGQELR